MAAFPLQIHFDSYDHRKLKYTELGDTCPARKQYLKTLGALNSETIKEVQGEKGRSEIRETGPLSDDWPEP
jgi:hypothetical protein